MLIFFGSETFETDLTLYLCQKRENFVFLVVNVNEILLIGSERKYVERMIQELKKKFEIRIFAKIERFLELSVQGFVMSTTIHNKDMTDRVLNFFKMKNCRPIATPLPHGIDLSL